jgi:ABC-2 type transport system permease protein
MRETLIIFRHEFLRTIRRTGFIILTLMLPLLILLGLGIDQIVSHVSKPAPTASSIGYVDLVGGFTGFTTQGSITFVPFTTRDEATRALTEKTISEYFVIPADFVMSGAIERFIMSQELEPPGVTVAAIQNFLTSNLLNGKVPVDVVSRVESGVNVATTTLNAQGTPVAVQPGYANFIVPVIFSIFLLMALVFTSTYVLQSLAEEKENRLMEILISSVSARQLLAGKVAGLGAAGLLQVLIWIVLSPLLLALASASVGGILATIHVPFMFWIAAVVYFLLGYFIFAMLSASVAAVTSSIQEAQGLSGFYSILAVVPLWTISLLILSPSSPVWVLLSIFPFTAPVEVMLRLGLTGVPWWQVALSVGVLLLCVVGGLLLASRLLQTYMLMYGKRPGLRQIFRAVHRS